MIDWTKPVRMVGNKKLVTVLSIKATGTYPVVAQIEGNDAILTWRLDGHATEAGLENVPEEQYCYLTVFEDENGKLRAGRIVHSKDHGTYDYETRTSISGANSACWTVKPVGILKVKLERRFDE